MKSHRSMFLFFLLFLFLLVFLLSGCASQSAQKEMEARLFEEWEKGYDNGYRNGFRDGEISAEAAYNGQSYDAIIGIGMDKGYEYCADELYVYLEEIGLPVDQLFGSGAAMLEASENYRMAK